MEWGFMVGAGIVAWLILNALDGIHKQTKDVADTLSRVESTLNSIDDHVSGAESDLNTIRRGVSQAMGVR